MNRLRKRNKFQRGGRPFVPSVGIRNVAGRTQQNLRSAVQSPLDTQPFFNGLAARDRRDAFNEAVFQDRRDTLLDFTKTFIPSTSGIGPDSYDYNDPLQRQFAQEDAQRSAAIQQQVLGAAFNGGGIQAAQELISQELTRRNSGDRLLHKAYNGLTGSFKSVIEQAAKNKSVTNFAAAEEVREASAAFRENRDQASLQAYSEAINKFNALPTITNEEATKRRGSIQNAVADYTQVASMLGSVGADPSLVKSVTDSKTVSAEAIKKIIESDAVTMSVFQNDAAAAGKDIDTYINDYIEAYSAVPLLTDREREAVVAGTVEDKLSQNAAARADALDARKSSRQSANSQATERVENRRLDIRERELDQSAASAASSNTTRVGNFNIPNDVIENLDAPASVVSRALSDYNQAIAENKSPAEAEAIVLEKYPALRTESGGLTDDFFNVKSVSISAVPTPSSTNTNPTGEDASSTDIREAITSNPIISELPLEDQSVAEVFLNNEEIQDAYFEQAWLPQLTSKAITIADRVGESINEDVTTLLADDPQNLRDLKLMYLVHHHGAGNAETFLRNGSVSIAGNKNADAELKAGWERLERFVNKNPEATVSEVIAAVESQGKSDAVNKNSSAIGKYQILFKSNRNDIRDFMIANDVFEDNTDSDNGGRGDGLVENVPFNSSEPTQPTGSVPTLFQ